MTVIDFRERQVAAQTAQEVDQAFQGGTESVYLLVHRRREFLTAIELLATWLERYSALQLALHKSLTSLNPVAGGQLLKLLSEHPGLSQWADELKQLVETNRATPLPR